MAAFFRLERPEHPWGLYGCVLFHGGASYRPHYTGPVRICRTGPYVPEVTFPAHGELVVTTEGKEKLGNSGLTGIDFAPAEKRHIVELHWETWQTPPEDAPGYPDSDALEDYIDHQEHRPDIAAQMKCLWEVCLPKAARMQRYRPDDLRQPGIRLLVDTWDGSDVFRTRGVSWIWCTGRAKDWFETHFAGSVVLLPVETLSGFLPL